MERTSKASAGTNITEATIELTQGGFVGTPAFASPEQFARGEVDARTDIYALGVTMWFALTGRLPFAGTTIDEIRERQAHHALPAEQLKSRAVPQPLIDLLRACLAFDPAERPASARELLAELEARRAQSARRAGSRKLALAVLSCAILAALASLFFLSRPSKIPFRQEAAGSQAIEKGVAVLPSAVLQSIAVLPFENLSKDEKENAFFTDGVQDEILADLAKVADLKVISRASVMLYQSGNPRNLREIGQQLGVTHVLEGSVQRSANRVRVMAQLIDARSDAHLWAQTYDRDLVDVFAIQSEIAQTIADQLHSKISPREKAAIAQTPTTDLEANKLYVQAKELADTSNDPSAKQNLLKATRLLEEAVARDPRFLLAYCSLSRVHLDLYWQGFDHTLARRELANAAIQAASRLQPDAGEVHLALAKYAYHGFRDYDRARVELDLAHSTLPNNVDIYLLTGAIDRRQGRWTEAIRNWERAVELDPRNFYLIEEAGFTYDGLRLYPQTSRLLERAVAISPHDYLARTALAQNPVDERADTRPLRATLSTILTEEPGASEKIAYGLFYCAMRERDSAATGRALTAISSDGLQDPNNFLSSREWFVGLAARTFGDASTAHSAFTAARAIQARGSPRLRAAASV